MDSGHKNNILLEFLSLITRQSSKANEISERIGIYEEDIETFEALIEFVITTTKYNLKIKPKILSEVKDTANL